MRPLPLSLLVHGCLVLCGMSIVLRPLTSWAATNPISQIAFIKASNPDTGDSFGYSVAISGNLLAIAAFTEASNAIGVDGIQTDNSATGAGAVYVYVRENGQWKQDAYVKAINTGLLDHFGASVALSGNTLVVGAPLEDSYPLGAPDPINNDNLEDSGAAYVYVRTGGTWSFQAMLKAGNGARLSREFGYSVAIDGDIIVVGARQERNTGTGINPPYQTFYGNLNGAAYVFQRSGTSWNEVAYIKPPYVPKDGSYMFGEKVGVSGKNIFVNAVRDASAARGINGDMTQDPTKFVSGAVFAYRLEPGGLVFDAFIKSSNSDPGDGFGWDLSASGDTLVVSAINEDSDATGLNGAQGNSTTKADSGAVYIFDRGASGWVQSAYLKAPATGAKDIFGRALSLSGDALAVSSVSKVSGPEGSKNYPGTVYLYKRQNGTWQFYNIAKPKKTQVNESYGIALALSSDSLLVSAPGDANGGTGVNNPSTTTHAGTGAAYVFTGFDGVNVSPIVIQFIEIHPQQLVFDFTADPGLSGWHLLGGALVDSLGTDLSGLSTVTETTAGHYRGVVTLPLPATASYFVKILPP